MPSEVEVDSGLVLATVTGPWSRTAAEQLQREIVDAMERGSCSGLLLDLRRAEIDVNTMGMFEITASHAEVFPLSFKHAVLVSESGLAREDARFCENVAMNRGIKMRIFYENAEAARRWLRQD